MIFTFDHSFGNRSSTVWSHHSCPAVTSLATNSAAHMLQNAMLVHKCLNGRAPHYLINECLLAGGRRSGTRSAGRQMLKSPGSIRHLATVHLLQRLHKPETVYLTPRTLLCVRTHLLSVWSHTLLPRPRCLWLLIGTI